MKLAWYAEMDFSPINIRCSGAWGEGSGVQQRTSEPEPKNKTQSSQPKALNYRAASTEYCGYRQSTTVKYWSNLPVVLE